MESKTKLSTKSDTNQLREFERSLPMLLLIARESVMYKFAPVLREHGLSAQQWRVMRALYECGSMTATLLAKQTYLMMPSMSRILKKMEERAIIKRTIDGEDLRRALITLTPYGVELFKEVAPWSEARYKHIESIIGKEKLDALYDLLNETITTLQEQDKKDSDQNIEY